MCFYPDLMALKTICSVPIEWTMADYQRHTCTDSSHSHISHSQLRAHQARDIVHVLRQSNSKREKMVVRIQILPVADNRWAGRPRKSRAASSSLNHGLSYRVGPYLAMRIRQREKWAIVMLSHINNRPEREQWNDQENSK